MKRTMKFPTLSGVLTFLCLTMGFMSFGQTQRITEGQPQFPWTEHQLMQPEDLKNLIEAGATDSIVILNVGPVNNIEGAITIGPTGEKEGIKALKKYLKNLPKDKAVVVYCGCCPMVKCPNIKPAFKTLTDAGFTNFKILDIETSLSEDWIAKGYPMADD